MKNFNFDLKKAVLIAFVFILPLIAINMQRAPNQLPWYLEFAGDLTAQIQNFYMDFSSGVRDTTSLYLNLINIKRENRLLQAENAKLKAKLLQFTELQVENQHLNALLDFRKAADMKLVAARVVARDLVADHQTIQINRGKKDGLKLGMAVIAVQGAVGYVFRLDDTSASVLMLTDPYSVIDAIVQRTRARGLVEGHSRDSCRLRYLERAQDVAVGDVIVTSGLANWPIGFPIARVTSVESNKYGVSQKVDLEPYVHPGNLEDVFVVLNPENRNYLPPAPPPPPVQSAQQKNGSHT